MENQVLAMVEKRHLTKAPIKEAVFDIRTVVDPKFNITLFDEARADLRADFPSFDIREGIKLTFEIGPEKPEPSKQEEVLSPGYFFKNTGNTELLQFRSDGFTFNRLFPYTSFDELIPRISRYWEIYERIAKPKVVPRIGLRFINKIELGMGEIEIQKYSKAGLQIPEGLPQEFSSYFFRITIEDRKNEIAANVSQRIKTEENEISYLFLDIDAFKRSPVAVNGNSILLHFHPLRDFKNMIFFSFLTEDILKELE